jgi:hypothetical protein
VTVYRKSDIIYTKPGKVEAGALVRTTGYYKRESQAAAPAVHRAQVSNVYLHEGRMWAMVAGADYRADHLEVIRPPIR